MRKLVYLQVMRAIAASFVVVDHTMGLLISIGDLPTEFTPTAFMFGRLGVSVFFVISGLIMVRQSANTFGSFKSGFDFAFRRILRVVPMYWIITILTVLRSGHSTFDASAILKSLFFIPYSTPGEPILVPIFGAGWTLNFEMFFYLIFSIALFFNRTVGMIFLFVAFLSLLLAGLFTHSLLHYVDPVDLFNFYTDPIILLFLAGVAVGYAEIHFKAWHSISYPIICSLVILAAIMGACLYIQPLFPLQLPWQAILAIGSTLIVLICTTQIEIRHSWLFNIFVKAGDASYSTYLFHGFAIYICSKLMFLIPKMGFFSLMFIGLVVITANVLGFCIHTALEKPISDGLKRLFQRTKPAAKSTPA